MAGWEHLKQSALLKFYFFGKVPPVIEFFFFALELLLFGVTEANHHLSLLTAAERRPLTGISWVINHAWLIGWRWLKWLRPFGREEHAWLISPFILILEVFWLILSCKQLCIHLIIEVLGGNLILVDFKSCSSSSWHWPFKNELNAQDFFQRSESKFQQHSYQLLTDMF